MAWWVRKKIWNTHIWLTVSWLITVKWKKDSSIGTVYLISELFSSAHTKGRSSFPQLPVATTGLLSHGPPRSQTWQLTQEMHNSYVQFWWDWWFVSCLSHQAQLWSDSLIQTFTILQLIRCHAKELGTTIINFNKDTHNLYWQMNRDLWTPTTIERFVCASWNKEGTEIETGDAESTIKQSLWHQGHLSAWCSRRICFVGCQRNNFR